MLLQDCMNILHTNEIYTQRKSKLMHQYNVGNKLEEHIVITDVNVYMIVKKKTRAKLNIHFNNNAVPPVSHQVAL